MSYFGTGGARAVLLGFLIFWLSAAATPRDARACGLFAPRIEVKAPPRLEHERTLILWDGSAHREHFVREVRFAGTGDQPFGFVVPTPGRPQVEAVKTAPFDGLESRFGHTLLDVPNLQRGEGSGSKGAAPGAAIGGAPPAVQVLEKKRVGDFVSFVLAANDAKALADWLKKNQFRISDDGRHWSERYVDLGFFFVALRYDGKKKKAGEQEALVSRTLRVSFDTPLPFYPYAEPADAPQESGRELQVWLLSAEPMLPLAGVSTNAGFEIVRPWSEGARYEPSRAELDGVIGSELAALVPGTLGVQTFGDWKEQRRGFADLVLAPAARSGCDVACVNARRPLLGWLDPSLIKAPPVDAGELVVGAGPRLPSGALLLFFAIGLGRRRLRASSKRRALVPLALALIVPAAACGHAPPPTAPPTPASDVASGAPSAALTLAVPGEEAPPPKPEPFALPNDAVARQKALMGLLAGRTGDRFVRTWSTPFERGIGRARNSLPVGLVDPAALERRCLGDDRAEQIVTYAFETGADGRIARARVDGPLPKSSLACIEHELDSGLRSAQGVANHGWISLGTISPDALELRQRIQQSKFTTQPRAGVQVKEIRNVVGPGLPKEVVTRIMRQEFGRFRACYESNAQPTPKGSVTLQFSISPDGRVAQLSAKTADVTTNTGVCVGNVVRNVAFPSPSNGAATRVTFELGFSTPPP